MKKSNSLKKVEPTPRHTNTTESDETKKETENMPITKNENESNRVMLLLQSAKNSNVGDILKKLEPVITLFSSIIDKIMPIIITIYSYCEIVYNFLPLDIIYALFGLGLTFFGGVYVLTIAACETFYMTGWETTKIGIIYLKTEFERLWRKSKKDDNKDENNDGIADVLQITAGELFTRKIGFFFATCRDPQKLMDMLGAICQSLLGVIAVLKVNFAMTIALGAMIGENLRKPASYFIVPIASRVLPDKYHKWIAPLINVICKFVAITIAWFIQRVISSVQSAIRGGLLFSRRILGFLNRKGYISFNECESYLEEYIGWAVAGLGVYFQITHFFAVPFPLNFFLFPISCMENYLQWIVSN